MSRLVTFNRVNVPVIDNVSARISFTNSVFPIFRSPPIDTFSFMETSLYAYSLFLRVVIPLTDKFPFKEVSLETKSLAFNDASCITNS